MAAKRALFLDRDGVIIDDIHLPSKIEDISLKIGIGQLLSCAKELDLAIVMASNQTVVSRGILSYEEMGHLNDQIIEMVREKSGGIGFDGVYLCPFHPQAQVEKYRQESDCRKPRPGMLLKAKNDLNIDLKNSFMVGDRPSDIIAGNLAGCTSILLSGEKTEEKLIESSLNFEPEMAIPDFRVDSLEKIIPLLKGDL